MGKRILVVDDDPVIRTLITEYLSSLGYEIDAVESGKLSLSKLQGPLPDLVLLDFQMPDMTGHQVLQSIRDNPRTATLPVIMLSANSDTESAVSQTNIKADRYLQKPFG